MSFKNNQGESSGAEFAGCLEVAEYFPSTHCFYKKKLISQGKSVVS